MISMKIVPSNLKNILVIRIGKLGDMVVTSFVFEVIKKNNPDIKITLITKETNRDLLKYNPNIDKCIYLKKGVKAYLQLFNAGKKAYDLIIDFNDNPSSTTKNIFRFFNATYKCGYNFDSYKKHLNISVNQLGKKESHIIDRMADFLKETGFEVDPGLVKPVVYLGKNELFDTEKILNKTSLTITFNISAGAKIRYWQIEKWNELKNEILNLFPNCQILVLSTESDRYLTDEICRNNKEKSVINPPVFSIQHFAAFIKQSDILISPDTAAIHFASAFSVPVVALFNSAEWNFISWQPYKTVNISLKSNDENSINSIEMTEVLNATKDLYNKIN